MRNLTLLLLVACKGASKTPTPAPETAAENPVAASVVAAMNPEVGACDDFYEYACGGWLANTELPPDRPNMTRSFTTIFDENQAVIRRILEEASKDAGDDPVKQKLGTFFGTCMDEAAVEAAGTKPLEPLFARIDGVKTRDDALEVAGELMSFGPNPFFSGGTWADPKDPNTNILSVMQEGLGLPDRSYYVDETDERKAVRAKYLEVMKDLFVLTGSTPEQAEKDAAAVMAFETSLAKHHWERAELRDAEKTYNKMTVDELNALAPSVDLKRWFAGVGIEPPAGGVIVVTPSYFEGMDAVVKATPVPVLKTYLRWHAIVWASPFLTKAIDQRRFAFFGTALSGTTEQEPRWKRCVNRTDDAMGEWLGKAYVQERFAGESKEVAEEMVAGIFAAFEKNLPNLAWMDETTRGRAVEKADAFRAKLGYPKTFRDYTEMEVVKGDLLANMRSAGAFNAKHQLDKVGKPVDPDEWHMTPQMVNAYYNPTGNEIVFPAGIMQSPFFDKDFPRAMNFGALGMVIGHELTHGFDDEGRKYAPNGELKEWWEPEASERFEEQAECVVDQYSSWEIAGVNVNGKLTLGENIADLGGLKVAHLAYSDWVAEHGEEPKLAGLTGEQQLFVAFAQGWCTLATEELQRVRVATDPHSPPKFRVNGPVMNLPAFAEAFGCEKGAPMAPADRCEVW
ncbi:MAG: M13 family metallopeptidase [Alphaproteobacteria bacterium]|nr:M13 family metallopeptidase [Alphaproteobacteria bacterium]